MTASLTAGLGVLDACIDLDVKFTLCIHIVDAVRVSIGNSPLKSFNADEPYIKSICLATRLPKNVSEQNDQNMMESQIASNLLAIRTSNASLAYTNISLISIEYAQSRLQVESIEHWSADDNVI